jgi:hypothetical protein
MAVYRHTARTHTSRRETDGVVVVIAFVVRVHPVVAVVVVMEGLGAWERRHRCRCRAQQPPML